MVGRLVCGIVGGVKGTERRALRILACNKSLMSECRTVKIFYLARCTQPPFGSPVDHVLQEPHDGLVFDLSIAASLCFIFFWG